MEHRDSTGLHERDLVLYFDGGAEDMNQIEHIMKLADSFAEYRDHSEYVHDRQALRAAIEQALAVQPEQEPVKDIGYEQDERVFARIAAMKKPQPKQEPVATKTEQGITLHVGWNDLPADTKLYTAPHPQREWVDLPPEEIKALANLPGADRERTAVEMAYAVQAKLREKNT